MWAVCLSCRLAAVLTAATAAFAALFEPPRVERLQAIVCVDAPGIYCDERTFDLRRWMVTDVPGEHPDDLAGRYEMHGVMGPSETLHVFAGGTFVRHSVGCTGEDYQVGTIRRRGDRVELRHRPRFRPHELRVHVVRAHAGHTVFVLEEDIDEFDLSPALDGGHLVR